MCCGEKRAVCKDTLRTAVPGKASEVPQAGPIIVRGRGSGREYLFSGTSAVQQVDPRDAETLPRTRFFRRT